MKVKTSELIGPALDWAVAKCEGREDPIYRFGDEPDEFYISGPAKQGPFNPSTDWSQGGPIIEREKIELHEFTGVWSARFSEMRMKADGSAKSYHSFAAATPLIATMRCYAASRLGDEVEIPEELT